MSELAINGGKPVRTEPFLKWPLRNVKEIIKLEEIWKSGDWGVGSSYTSDFERKFAARYNCKYALSVANGTTSMWIGLKAHGIKEGDEVIIPPYTFFATAVAVLLANAIPVFVDVDPDTFNIDPEKIEEAITPRTKAIIPVHIGGLPCDMEKINGIARKHNLLVIEDAAQAHYAEINGQMIGTFGDLGSFSFQMSKNMTSGEGGILISNNKELMDKCFSYQNFGRVRGGEWYMHILPSSNNRMTAFQAGVLSEQLDFCDSAARKREQNIEYFFKHLANIGGLIPQKRAENITRHAFHLVILKYSTESFNDLSREKFIEALNAEGIPCSSGYVPLYSLPVFKNLSDHYSWLKDINYSNLNLPNCESLCKKESVWFNQNLFLGTNTDIDDIIEAIAKIKSNVGEIK